MHDTPRSSDPPQPLSADATDEQMRDRLNFLLVDKGYWPGAASVELAREFAATLVAAERAKIAQDTRTPRPGGCASACQSASPRRPVPTIAPLSRGRASPAPTFSLGAPASPRRYRR